MERSSCNSQRASCDMISYLSMMWCACDLAAGAAPEGAPGPCTAMDIPDDTNSTRTSTSPLAYLLGDSHDVQAVLQEVHTTGFWSGRVKHSGCVLPAPPAATCHPAAAAAAHASEDPFSSGHPQCQSFALANSSALLTTGGTFMTGAPTRGRGNSTFQLLQLSLHSTAHAAPQIPGSSILSGTTIGMHTDTGSGFFSSSITWSTSGRAPAKPGKKLRRASTCLDGALDMAEAPRTQALLNSRLNTLTPGTRSSGAKKHAPTRSRHAPKQGGGLHKGRVKGGRQPPHLEQPKHERSQAGTHSEVHARGVRLRGAAHPRMSIDVRRMSVEVWRAPRAIPAKRHAGVDVAHGLHGASAAAQAVEAAAVGHAHAAAAGTDGPAGATVEGAATKAGRCTAVQQQEQHAWAGSTGSSATLDCSVFGSNCVHSQSMLAAGEVQESGLLNLTHMIPLACLLPYLLQVVATPTMCYQSCSRLRLSLMHLGKHASQHGMPESGMLPKGGAPACVHCSIMMF